MRRYPTTVNVHGSCIDIDVDRGVTRTGSSCSRRIRSRPLHRFRPVPPPCLLELVRPIESLRPGRSGSRESAGSPQPQQRPEAERDEANKPRRQEDPPSFEARHGDGGSQNREHNPEEDRVKEGDRHRRQQLKCQEAAERRHLIRFAPCCATALALRRPPSGTPLHSPVCLSRGRCGRSSHASDPHVCWGFGRH